MADEADTGLSEEEEQKMVTMALMVTMKAVIAELSTSKSVDGARLTARLIGLEKFMVDRFPQNKAFIGEIFMLYVTTLKDPSGG